MAEPLRPFPRLQDESVEPSGIWIDGSNNNEEDKETAMLRLALMFLVIALIAALLGFTGITLVAVDIARLLFFIFLVLFIISLVAHLFYGRSPPPPL